MPARIASGITAAEIMPELRTAGVALQYIEQITRASNINAHARQRGISTAGRDFWIQIFSMKPCTRVLLSICHDPEIDSPDSGTSMQPIVIRQWLVA